MKILHTMLSINILFFWEDKTYISCNSYAMWSFVSQKKKRTFKNFNAVLLQFWISL